MKKKITQKEARSLTQQDIQDYLDGLNRTNNGVAFTADSARLEAIAVENYRRWFSDRGIAIHQDENTGVWKLGKQVKKEHDRRRN